MPESQQSQGPKHMSAYRDQGLDNNFAGPISLKELYLYHGFSTLNIDKNLYRLVE